MKLISSPAKAWEEISMEEDRRKVYMAFVYDWFMRSVRIHWFVTDQWMGRSAKFPDSYDQLLCRSGSPVRRLFSGSIRHK